MSARVRRGQPLAALVLLLGGWIAVRAAIWERPVVFADPMAQREYSLVARPPSVALAIDVKRSGHDPLPPAFSGRAAEAPALRIGRSASPRLVSIAAPAAPVRVAIDRPGFPWTAALAGRPPARAPAQPWAAPPPAVADRQPRTTPPERRWSADGWLLWRRGGTGQPAAGFTPAGYGASQFGAVVRYRLARSSAHRPALYLRAGAALRSPRDEEVAAGFAARPLARVPVVAMAELRATRLGSGVALRPAVALVSAFPPLRLPLGARVEAYGQAGYVAGKGATPFVDGQLRIDRPLFKLGAGELRAGGGAWGGAQRAVSRVDIGPSLTLGVPIGRTNVRIAAEWRWRVAGNAAPTSGPALTLSAGF